MNPMSILLPIVLAAPPGCSPSMPCGPTGPVINPLMMRSPLMMPQTCPPLGPPAPVLAIKMLLPAGAKLTLQPGSGDAKRIDPAVTVGFRPGYSYRLEISDIPNNPGLTLYPVLEVRGSLVPRVGMNVMEFPAPLYLTRTDLERVAAGAVITKVIYLEDPTKAVPVETKPDQPLEFSESAEQDALREAINNGRVVAVLRVGDRVPESAELKANAVPGTVFLPGEAIAPAAAPAMLPCWPVPMYDPILGPKPTPEECLTDGGDKGLPLGFNFNGKLGGLDPTDVGAEYTVGGKRRVSTSNQVCICSPRYVIRKVELGSNAMHLNAGLESYHQLVSRKVVSTKLPAEMISQKLKPFGAIGRLKLSVMVVSQGVASFVDVVAPQAFAKSQGLQLVGSFVEPEEITSIPNQLVLTKSVDPNGPVKPGEVVTFTIKYRNATRAPITDMLLSDSLSGRLQYVPGSAQFDRPTNVTTVENEAGSVIVRFEIPGPIPPGQTGEVKFQAKVR
jgi:uncharacterized repeat protein (TIGR01451 family)